MVNVTLELIWIRNLLTEIGFPPDCLMRLYGDNKAAIHIAENVVFYERTKHIEVDCHIVCKKLKDGEECIIRTSVVSKYTYQTIW